MFVRVDEDMYDPIEGFTYAGMYGDIEAVVIGDETVTIKDSEGACANVYNGDIPKLIKALQAAYDHIQKGK